MRARRRGTNQSVEAAHHGRSRSVAAELSRSLRACQQHGGGEGGGGGRQDSKGKCRDRATAGCGSVSQMRCDAMRCRDLSMNHPSAAGRDADDADERLLLRVLRPQRSERTSGHTTAWATPDWPLASRLQLSSESTLRACYTGPPAPTLRPQSSC